jgi:hypothetical protein
MKQRVFFDILTAGTTFVHSRQNKNNNPTTANIQTHDSFHHYLRSRPTVPLVYVPLLIEKCDKNKFVHRNQHR